MNRELNRLTFLLVLAFGVVALGTSFWTLVERDDLRQREDNPRRVLAELNARRGTIYDRHGETLAFTRAVADGVERVYPYPEVVSAVGHYSYQYGQAGLEEGFHNLLSGANLRDSFEQWRTDLFNMPVEGADIRSTLDLSLQLSLAKALNGYSGAGIVVHVPSGQVLAMVSAPSYDPNQIDEIGRNLQTPPARLALLNRVTDGRYQPGGTLQTLLLSEMLGMGVAADSPVTNTVMVVDNLSLDCNLPTVATEITLAEAYWRGCPTPFVAALGTTIPMTAFEGKLTAAGLADNPALAGFVIRPRLHLITYAQEDPLSAAAGQGVLTVSPLQMVQLAAAMVNGGNGVPLTLADATRRPSDEDWQSLDLSFDYPSVMQPSAAQTIRQILTEHPWSADIYGHASRAYAGNREYAWFLGWTPLEDGTYAVMAVVVESPIVQGFEAVNIGISTLRQIQ